MAVRRRSLLLATLLVAGVLCALLVLALGGDDPEPVVLEPFSGETSEAVRDPYAYDPERRAEFERRAAAGLAHPLYAFSPGGVEATARRVIRFRAPVEAVARRAGVEPDMVEALVFLESAGRPDARASDDLAGAVGLTQILAETATNLLGMRVDLARSRRLTRLIARGRGPVQERRRERRRIDERFDPRKALAGTGRYLTIALEELGRADLALTSYHMGIGNLSDVLAAHGEGRIPYAQLFFDSSPLEHPEAWDRLASLGDDSATYLWRVLAAREIMRLYRTDVEALRTLARLHEAKNSAEEVLHPEGTSVVFDGPDAVAAATETGSLTALDRALLAGAGLRIDRRMGELADRLDRPRKLYRALRPEALRVLLDIGRAVRQISGTGPLVVTSTVRDAEYQGLLVRRNDQATRRYSLHTTGFAFDIRRRYRSGAQARAFQFVLDRLTALDVIAWVREPGAIHITVAG
jgi:hypothetical protein